jgi:hypothetical protein
MCSLDTSAYPARQNPAVENATPSEIEFDAESFDTLEDAVSGSLLQISDLDSWSINFPS